MPRGIPNRKAAEPDLGDETTDQTPTSDGTDPDPTPAPDPAPATDEPRPCPQCFPDGWPAGATSVGCVHGQWDRATAGD